MIVVQTLGVIRSMPQAELWVGNMKIAGFNCFLMVMENRNLNRLGVGWEWGGVGGVQWGAPDRGLTPPSLPSLSFVISFVSSLIGQSRNSLLGNQLFIVDKGPGG